MPLQKKKKKSTLKLKLSNKTRRVMSSKIKGWKKTIKRRKSGSESKIKSAAAASAKRRKNLKLKSRPKMKRFVSAPVMSLRGVGGKKKSYVFDQDL